MKARAYLLMLFVVAVWGSTFVLIKSALADASPVAFNLARMTLAFVVLAVAYHRFWRGIHPGQIGAGALVGLFLADGLPVPNHGTSAHHALEVRVHYRTCRRACSLFSAIPALRPPGARAPRWNAFLGAVLAFIGILLLTAPAPAQSGIGRSSACANLLPDLHSINTGDMLTFRLRSRLCTALHRAGPRLAAHRVSAARSAPGWLLRGLHGASLRSDRASTSQLDADG